MKTLLVFAVMCLSVMAHYPGKNETHCFHPHEPFCIPKTHEPGDDCVVAAGVIAEIGVIAGGVLNGLICPPFDLLVGVSIPPIIEAELNASCVDLTLQLQAAVQLATSLLGATCDSTNQSCPLGYTEFGGNCYKHVHSEDGLTWDEANEYCQRENSRLVVLRRGGLIAGLVDFLKRLLCGEDIWINVDVDINLNVGKRGSPNDDCDDDTDEDDEGYEDGDCDDEDEDESDHGHLCPIMDADGDIVFRPCHHKIHHFVCEKSKSCPIVAIIRALVAAVKKILLLAVEVLRSLLHLLPAGLARLIEHILCVVIDLVFTVLDTLVREIAFLLGCI